MRGASFRQGSRCSETDAELWFAESDQPGKREVAKRLCEDCLSRVICMALCFETDSQYGIWAGTQPSLRRSLHAVFNRGVPDSIAFAEQVIAEYDERYGLPSENARARAQRAEESKLRRAVRERDIRAEKARQLHERRLAS